MAKWMTVLEIDSDCSAWIATIGLVIFSVGVIMEFSCSDIEMQFTRAIVEAAWTVAARFGYWLVWGGNAGDRMFAMGVTLDFPNRL